MIEALLLPVANRNLMLDRLEELVADTGYLFKGLDALERPVRLAMLNNRLRPGLANAIERHQGSLLSGIDVHQEHLVLGQEVATPKAERYENYHA
jgi:hypothetical protein